MLTGEPISAERANELGLVNRLAPAGGALDAAFELAAEVARNAPLALAASKRIIDEQFDWGEEEFWARQIKIAGPVMVSRDAMEGRPPSRKSAIRSGRGANAAPSAALRRAG